MRGGQVFRWAAATALAAGAGVATAWGPVGDRDGGPHSGREIRVSDRGIELSPLAVSRMKVLSLPLVPSREAVTLRLTGKTSFDWDHVAHVKALFPGKIIETGPPLGTAVRGPGEPPGGKGTFLCRIESVDLGNAKNAFLKARVQLNLDTETARRVKELVVQEVLADRFLKEAEASVRLDEAGYEFARQSLLIFGVGPGELEKIPAQERWDRIAYDVESPVSGVVAEKNVTRGEVADSMVNLFTIADTRRMWVWGDVYEMDWGKVKVGQRLRVDIGAAGRSYGTVVDLVAPALDPVTRGIRVRGSIENPDRKILNGMYADLTVVIGEDPGALTAPAESVVRGPDAAEAFVFVRRSGVPPGGGETFELRPVQVEEIENSRVRLLSGVVAGESIVTSGAAALLEELRRK